MENTPLCYIAANCNIDGRQTDGNRRPTPPTAQSCAYTYMLIFGRADRPHPLTLYTRQTTFSRLFQKIEKIVLTNGAAYAILCSVGRPPTPILSVTLYRTQTAYAPIRAQERGNNYVVHNHYHSQGRHTNNRHSTSGEHQASTRANNRHERRNRASISHNNGRTRRNYNRGRPSRRTYDSKAHNGEHYHKRGQPTAIRTLQPSAHPSPRTIPRYCRYAQRCNARNTHSNKRRRTH